MNRTVFAYFRKLVAACLSALILLCALPFANAETTVASVSSANVSEPNSGAIAYADYLKQYSGKTAGNDKIRLETGDFSAIDMQGYQKLDNYENREGTSLLTTNDGSVSYQFSVKTEGFYTVTFSYIPYEGTGAAIIRSLSIDGKVPYAEAAGVTFTRSWTDGGKVTQDAAGNDIRPKQVESPKWMDKDACDASGYYIDPLRFYLSAGTHTLTVTSVEESMVVRSITLQASQSLPSYEDALRAWQQKGYKQSSKTIRMEAENAAFKSAQSIYMLNDRTSPVDSPYDYKAIRYNTIGADKWQMPGQWIEWDITVPESGLYAISLRYRQNLKSNDVSSRTLYIDNAIPFQEAQSLEFHYNSSWQMESLGEKQVKGGYLFYLSEGLHTLRMEVTLGRYSTIVKDVKESILALNDIYRSIAMITGYIPDMDRDYHFDKVIPDVIKRMSEQSETLKKAEADIKAVNGSGGQSTAAINRLYKQLDDMVKQSTTISKRLTDFKDNIAALGTWVTSGIQQPLEIDYLLIRNPEASLPEAEANIFGLTKHLFLQFLGSFFMDYSSIGVTGRETSETITVWVGSSSATGLSVSTSAGRDQAQAIKQMINEIFTPVNNIGVNVQLVSMGALLPASLAGIGPDVALQQSQSEPMNYALRKAVYDLSKFPDAESVASRFYPSALAPFRLGSSLYAMPETQTFPMLFYRKDILKDMDISEGDLKSWDSIFQGVLPKIQKYYLEFGVPPGMNSYTMFLYQEGGSVYVGNDTESGMGSAAALKAFRKYTEIYTDYIQPIAYDFANRFRSGQMPLGVWDFTMYNQLSVFAPEINGLWGMLPVPGTVQQDGSINKTVAGNVTGCILLSGSQHIDAAWKFIKWWTDADTQAQYGRELESVLGTAARYPTANAQAMQSISWNKETRKQIMAAWQSVDAIPEIPGGYMTGRYLEFAFRDVVYNGKEPRETLNAMVKSINQEITNKREEFGLPLSSIS